jgi:myo-inositol-1(or 4)-monophosphatase
MNICKNLIDIIKSSLDIIISLRNEREIKPDGSYVTKGDLMMEDLIIKYFKKTFKDCIIISEESYDNKKYNLIKDKLYITIDPIDGTENFTSGLREWGIGVSIYKGEEHFESLIALPELNEYVLSGSKFQKFESRIYGLSSALNKKDLINLDEGFEYRIIGCCMYNMLSVIKGSYKVFENKKGANSWDILPGLNIALENELTVTVEGEKYNGEFLQPNKKYSFKITNY